MSTKSPRGRSRRKGGDVRQDALLAGRDLLVKGGPEALTLKAVGAALGMSHANLLHHFGSAEAFQRALKVFMVDALTRRMAALAAENGGRDVGGLVGAVFDAYAADGIGVVMAWSALRGEPPGSLEAVGELVAVLTPQMVGAESERRARDAVCLVTALALADSLIGTGLAAVAGGERGAVRALTVAMVERLRDRPGRG